MAKRLYKFHWDCGRMGDVEAVFVEDPRVVALAIGTSVVFGEILGKHSDVQGTLERGDIEELTDDAKVVAIFDEHVGDVGHNPISAIYQREDESGDAGDAIDEFMTLYREAHDLKVGEWRA